MNINAVRLIRFRQLVDETEGGQAALAKVLGYANPTYISQMYTGKRNIGEKSARRIETAAGKPPGWLDSIQETLFSNEENQTRNKIKEQQQKYGGKLPGSFDFTDDEYTLILLYRKLSVEQQKFIRVSISGLVNDNNGNGKTKRSRQA